MRSWLRNAVLAGVLMAGVASAQPTPTGEFTQLFISPCGEPYRGRPTDPYPVVLWFKQADTNHDGVIDRAEFRADHAGFFDALDADANGFLDGSEVGFYEHKVLPDVFMVNQLGALSGEPRIFLAQTGSSGGYVAPGGGSGPLPSLRNDLGRRSQPLLGAQAFGLLREAEPLRAADANLDGRVSKAEFLAAADRRFDRLDRRKDGKLTLDELPKTAVQEDLEAAHPFRKR